MTKRKYKQGMKVQVLYLPRGIAGHYLYNKKGGFSKVGNFNVGDIGELIKTNYHFCWAISFPDKGNKVSATFTESELDMLVAVVDEKNGGDEIVAHYNINKVSFPTHRTLVTMSFLNLAMLKTTSLVDILK